MTRAELNQAIYEASHLTGEFTLRSGKVSTEYFDKYRFEAQPSILKAIAKLSAPMVPADADYLAGLEMGGIPLATALSLETGRPTVFVRKEAKTYGTCQFAEGNDIAGKKLFIIEDVITTGGQVFESAAMLNNAGAEVVGVLCVIFRGDQSVKTRFENENLPLQHLFTMEELKGS
ncbi:MAG: orotate phosphoribosyltransferase [Pseudobdellovibrionaceae bacterium]|nr:orotate phosphoribosyltransferase [Bdellovibrionales bacterium]USN46109.1 MAG: orotate phosphoribosyltransferase [Pseudobdellovibrionaceae bacterium]